MNIKSRNTKPWYLKWWFYIIIFLFWFGLLKAIDFLYLSGIYIKQPNTVFNQSDIIVYAWKLIRSIIDNNLC